MASIPFDPDEIIDAIEESVVEELINFGEIAAQALVFATPVGMPELWQNPPPADYSPGHARFNWRAQINSAILEERPGMDPGGGATVSEMRQVVRSVTNINQEIHFSLTIPYGFRLDNGWSTQRPRGFTEQALNAARAATATQGARAI